jgi:hypothetical protein
MKSQKKAQKAQAKMLRREKVQGGRKTFAPVAVNEIQQFSGGSRNGRRSWRFSGRELIGDINGSTSFVTTKYSLNPGIGESFPWLSGEADKWEQYRFHKLRFEYVPRCASTTVGSVLMSPDYNIRDQSPSTEVEAADTFGAKESSVWSGFGIDLDPNAMFPLGPRKMIRGAIVAGDMNLYDVGALYVSTTGEGDTSLIGKLWVEYDVEFFVPQNSPSDYSGPSRTSFFWNSSSQNYINNAETPAIFNHVEADPLGIGPQSGGYYVPKKGSYLVMCSMSFEDSANEAFKADVSIKKNGTMVTQSQATESWGATYGYLGLTLFAVVSCNGGDKIEVDVTLIGNAGVLRALQQNQILSFRPA